MPIAMCLALFDPQTAAPAPCPATCAVMDYWDIGRIVLTAIVAGGLISAAYKNMVWKVEPNKDHLGNFVAFNSVAFSILGAAVVVMSTKQWPTVLLAVGACMGIGFLLGLLFGYPMSNAGGKATTDANGNPQPANLLQQSVDAISKLVAGATLVQAGAIYGEFKKVAHALSQYGFVGGISCDSGGYVFGASVTLYFLLLGFLSALLLANTYHLVTPVPDSPTDVAAKAKADDANGVPGMGIKAPVDPPQPVPNPAPNPAPDPVPAPAPNPAPAPAPVPVPPPPAPAVPNPAPDPAPNPPPDQSAQPVPAPDAPNRPSTPADPAKAQDDPAGNPGKAI